MDSFLAILSTVNSTVWGPPMLVLILGTGLYLSLGLRGFSITHLPKAFGDLWSGRHHGDRKSGEISPYTALMTSLSSMVGTGNIAGNSLDPPGCFKIHLLGWKYHCGIA